MIRAPFNFVPLSDKVFFPDWAAQVSQDVPFSDGISGTIELEVTAKTPIFVRNGHTKEEAKGKADGYKAFCNADGRYFIPATSIKGCIRNVLEIMSFGKLRLDKSIRYAQREWYNTKLYSIKTPEVQQKIRCGWLKKAEEGDGYVIVDCGTPKRISHTRIDDYLDGYEFEDHFGPDGVDLKKEETFEGQKFDRKSAVYKYKKLVGDEELLEGLSFIQDEDYSSVRGKKGKCVKVSNGGKNKGTFEGTIVLTGQPDRWRRSENRGFNAGKFFEFVFETPNKEAKEHVVTKEEFEQYKFIYADSPDWKFASAKVKTPKGMPVFFRLKGDGSIKDWGLAFLYKLPYENSPYEILPSSHRKERLDMADCIFGYTSKGTSLKGRVQFSPLWSSKAEIAGKAEVITLALNSPKASYYPIYIDQEGNGQNGNLRGNCTYKTYNDGHLKGWKRYHVRKTTWASQTGQEKIDTVFCPLKAGAVFSGKVAFHNLRPEELGALLSALTFHADQRCFHQIGMAKPYGYGKVSLKIVKIDFNCTGSEEKNCQKDSLFYMAFFERIMADFLGSPWPGAKEIRQLLTLAGKEVGDGKQFQYMQLGTNSRNNEFANAKMDKVKDEYGKKISKPREYLPYYGPLVDIKSLHHPDVDEAISARKERLNLP